MQDNNSQNPPSPKPRVALKLIQGGPEVQAPASEAPAPEAKPRRKSALVQFMTAYADSIDRDVKLLLDL